MANKKITALPALGATPATDDVLPIVDVSGTATTKKVTVANLVAAAPQGDLLASNNLSDVANAGTSRTNLGLGTAATTASTDYATAFFNIVTKTASYTLTNAENGKVIFCNSGSRIDITVPSGLTSGFNCRVVQGGAGRVRFVTSGTTINGYASGASPNAVIGQHGVADLVPTGTNIYSLHGDIDHLSVFANQLSISFDGSDDILTTDESNLATSGDCTISLWFKANSFSNFEYIFRLTGTQQTGRDRMLGISSSKLSGNTYASGFGTLGNTTLSTGTWFNAAVVYSGGSFILYLNGSADSSSISATMATATYTETSIGKSYNTEHFDGLIDEVSVFHSALSPTNIASIYNDNGGVPGDLSSLNPKGWWRNGDGTGDTNSGGGTPANTDTVGTVANQGSVNTGSGEGNMTGTNGPTFSNTVPS